MAARRRHPHHHARRGRLPKLTLAGDLRGTLDGVPLTIRARGDQVVVSLSPAPAAIRGLLRSRRALGSFRRPARLGVRVTVRLGPIRVARLSL